jgi:nucleoside-diphosphate-sugar epimerase
VKILITGNLGYVGPQVVQRLRESREGAWIGGLDAGFFAHCLTGASAVPERLLDAQYFTDVRATPPEILEGVDAIVHLAGISNDPIGNAFEEVTLAINHRATVALAAGAKAAGVGAFIFASSCSIYGQADDAPRDEESELGPLTAYARSKALAEADLAELADESFTVTCLRFATACGMSDRLRLDLVLNDFVASAIAAGRIDIMSDGTPWRPLIHVSDMARAIDWAIGRSASSDDASSYLAVNVGTDVWNFQVRELAEGVARALPGITVSVNPDAVPDKRSYRVNFAKFERLAPAHQPGVDLQSAVLDLTEGLRRMAFRDVGFRGSQLARLPVLTRLRSMELIDEELRWRAPTKGLLQQAGGPISIGAARELPRE